MLYSYGVITTTHACQSAAAQEVLRRDLGNTEQQQEQTAVVQEVRRPEVPRAVYLGRSYITPQELATLLFWISTYGISTALDRLCESWGLGPQFYSSSSYAGHSTFTDIISITEILNILGRIRYRAFTQRNP